MLFHTDWPDEKLTMSSNEADSPPKAAAVSPSTAQTQPSATRPSSSPTESANIAAGNASDTGTQHEAVPEPLEVDVCRATSPFFLC